VVLLTTAGTIVLVLLSLLGASRLAATPPDGRMPRVGVLVSTSAAVASAPLEAFRQRLRELGYVEGQTLALEYRFAEGRYDRIADLSASLVRLPVDVLVAGSPSMIRAATQATTIIPVVGIGVPTGVFAGLLRPGANLTGVATGAEEIRRTGQDVLQALLPGASRLAILWDAHGGTVRRRAMEIGARLTGVRLQALKVQGPHEFERAFAAATMARADALIVPGSGLFAMHSSEIAALALQHHLPTLAPFREFVEAGCLMAYGPNVPDLFRQAASTVDRLLRGATPGDLPVEEPMRFELAINLQTARALGLTVPLAVLSRASVVRP
jgi:putative tryptophan/tyrosine transport system substrate-binding protein